MRRLAVGVALFAISTFSIAGGFAIMEQSVRGLGQSFAGATTGLGDGSSIFYNPAALGKQRGRQFGLLGSRIAPSMVFYDQGSTAIPEIGGFPLPGVPSGDGGDAAWVPNLYYMSPVGQRMQLGFSINAPYGLASEYEPGWQGRYQALRSEMLTINANLSLAYRVTDRFSAGFGLSYYKVETELGNAIDMGSLAFQALGPQVATQLGFVPMGTDGAVKVEGDGDAFGFNLGLHYQLTDHTELALGYKPEVDIDLAGDAYFTVPQTAIPLTQMGLFVDDTVTADITFPEIWSFGLAHRFQRLTVALDALNVGWSSFQELRIKFDSGQPDAFVDESWKDSWRYALGFNYIWSNNLIVRAGYAIDDTPIPDPQHRTPRIPDNDRTWYSAGFTYVMNPNLTIDLAYADVRSDDTDMENSAGTDLLRGSFELAAEVFSIGFTYRY